MKTLLTLILAAVVPMSVLAQTVPSRKTHFAHGKPTAKTVVAAATPAPVSVQPLSPAALVLAQQVHVGLVPCELGASVSVEADARNPGYFHIRLGKEAFHMAPVETSTGALRLEDRHAGAVWLQLANKSMMMSDRLGKRLVDECMSPAQQAVAQALLRNPPPSLLEPVAKPVNALALQDAAE